ncbi:Octicosapeptide/Phox/Bem1p family protein [Zea mays]|uniref:Octicosapeptide/Phox/Bem1p family protein n=1 Tax=Zea mays TaxID=4577 RepID=A0A1D6L063_MAIZE|nr:Octicosapeptide/Phox/Bem1p family protein [Zea mays]
MAPEAPSRRGDNTHMKLLCSHGGRFQPCGPDGELRYVGGETRVLVVPRTVSFRDLAARLAEMAGGSVQVRAIRHRLADEGVEDVIVTVTCDEEVAHMRDEYDRLRATRPAARFRVYVTTTASPSSAGRVAAVSNAAAARDQKATSRDVEAAVESRRAIWELE